MKTKSLPPIEILDFLHEAEEMGMELPPSIDEWWEEETYHQELDKDNKKGKK